MKKLIPVVVFHLLFLVGTDAQIHLITYNIRLNTPADGADSWPNRKEKVAALLKFHGANIFCIQEALPEQVRFLEGCFPDFRYEGVGRDDGREAGEYSAIFFDTLQFTRKDGGTFWLSETPDQCSYGWDAACRRVCTWVSLEDPVSGRSLYVFNTHFDHIGVRAREASVRLILERIIAIAGRERVLLCGDFNLPPQSAPIAEIGKYLSDAYRVSQLPPYGPEATYQGFACDSEPGARIDYVFVSEGIEVLRYGSLTDSEAGRFHSDHLPVLVTLSMDE
ncbi:MAG: endonuclease/exonuclease/phosphatase family protein [Bacteroidales bacterium]|nr:endonuclease/exonuclease/phosphatase family protein [Bacteroidales bacterium]MBN2698817.1 endonuclease/exonuclease/phosphatase family protein [Bacteroidales bacterium]